MVKPHVPENCSITAVNSIFSPLRSAPFIQHTPNIFSVAIRGEMENPSPAENGSRDYLVAGHFADLPADWGGNPSLFTITSPSVFSRGRLSIFKARACAYVSHIPT